MRGKGSPTRAWRRPPASAGGFEELQQQEGREALQIKWKAGG